MLSFCENIIFSRYLNLYLKVDKFLAKQIIFTPGIIVNNNAPF